MYDRQTESWWQQFTGEAIVGSAHRLGAEAGAGSSRSTLAEFKAAQSDGKVLVPNEPRTGDY